MIVRYDERTGSGASGDQPQQSGNALRLTGSNGNCLGKMIGRQMSWARHCKVVGATIVVAFAASLFLPAEAEDIALDNTPPTYSSFAGNAVAFDIPAQSLASALTAYSTVTGIPVFYNSRLTQGRRSQAVEGVFGAKRGLAILLGETELDPIETSHSSITLILHATDAVYAITSPIAAPQLALFTMHVAALPLGNHQLYASAVRSSIQGALQRASAVNRNTFQVDMNVWLTSTGMIRRMDLLVPTGRADVDLAITRALHGLTIGAPPPALLPQPVHVNILVGGRSS